MSFSDLGLSPETLKAVAESGYEKPTPIQEQAIPYVLMGRDVLGIAQTGTGKTAGFTLPMIDILAHGRAKARMPRSLIVAPTRELANQVADNFIKYGRYHKLSMALLIGGESFVEQEKLLSRGVDVLIATPGRLLDLFDRGRILLQDVKVLVIDEADRMLDMGFIPDVERIVSLLPPLRQTLFFSATMDKQIGKLADAFLHNPKEVRVAPPASAAETVAQHLAMVGPRDKRQALRAILEMENVKNAFIFCNRKRDVGVLYRSLTRHGYDAAQLHGDMAQSERTAALAAFKDGKVRLMVCSDVAARGIDVANVSHVFNFDVPTHSEDYVHRIGRTGRAGQAGRAYTIATPADTKYVVGIEKLIGQAIPRIEVEGLEAQAADEDETDRKKRGRRKDVKAKPDAQKSARPDDRKADKTGKGRKRRGHPSDEVQEMAHGPDVLAFGDHIPAFMLAPLTGTEARAQTAADSATAEKAAPKKRRTSRKPAAAEAAPADSEAAAAPAPEEKPKRRRTARKKTSEEAPTPEAPTPEAEVQPETAAEATADTATPDAARGDTQPTEPEEKPKRKRAPRKRTAKKTAESAESADAAATDSPSEAGSEGEASAEAPAPKTPARRRTARPKSTARKTAAAPAEDDSADGAKTEAEAPKRPTRRRRTATAKKTEAADAAEQSADAAVSEKPKRKRATRAKKTPNSTAEDTGTADTPKDAASVPESVGN